nr:MAG TPA: hypothetical protein [Caudoviricetes sp.]
MNLCRHAEACMLEAQLKRPRKYFQAPLAGARSIW